ncbi:MAG: MobA/MobL family protein, partial [Propionivibrio sp.]|nr:MobA/MobL family protein [Propionivibrio sp.]
MAIYHLSHRTVGRTTHAAGTAGAHVGYITRATACRAVIAQHIPEAAPGSKGGAARAWLDAQELADRKNARVIDKLEIALPIELDQAQRIEAVRVFVRDLAGGRSVPFLAAIHDKAGTKDEATPHAHVVIRDRDPATGKGRVIGMS